MKKLILITSLLLSTSAFAGNISYKCQQGVGNRSNPDPILNIEGNLRKDASKTGEYSEAEKNQLKVTIFDGNSLVNLNSSDFKMSFLVDAGFNRNPRLEIEILTGNNQGMVYALRAMGHAGEALVQVLKKTLILQRLKVADTGLCMGHSPYSGTDPDL